MDIIESRKISYKNNIVRLADGNIQGVKHTLHLHKEGFLYIVSLYDSKTRVADKVYLFRSRADKYFKKLTKKYAFIHLIPKQQEPEIIKKKK